MIDLHIHIIPGVDDGSPDIEDSIMMAEMAVECGVHTVVATPHANWPDWPKNYWRPELIDKFNYLNNEILHRNIPLKVLPGMEILATEDMYERILSKDLISLNHSNRYLIEFPFNADLDWIEDRIQSVLKAEGQPLIAHAERFRAIQERPEVVYDWVQQGCLIQVNKGSFFGRFGRASKHAAELLLEHDLITCLASDAHSPYMRTPWMEDIQEFLLEEFGFSRASLLLEKNPSKIIYGEKIEPHGQPIRRGFLYR